MAWESILPPSMSSSMAEMISLNFRSATESRRSRNASMMGMPAREICSMS